MKKRFLAVLPMVLLLSFTAFAQLEKGTILLGGGVGYSSSTSLAESYVATDREFTNSTFNFSPDFGFFFQPKWVVGLSLPISGSNQKTSSLSTSGSETLQNESTSNSFGLAPFVRKYFSVSEAFSFYAQAKVGFYQFKSESINYSTSGNSTNTSESSGVGFNATAGMSYFPKNWLGINLSVSPLSFSTGSSQQESSESSLDQESSGFSFGLDTSAITLGVNFFLSKK